MKIQLKKNKNKFLILSMLVSTIGIVLFSTLSGIVLYNHGVPNIDYESFLGNDYWQYLLFGLLLSYSVFSFVIVGYELVKGILQAKLQAKGEKNG